jgi:hypothetical protein
MSAEPRSSAAPDAASLSGYVQVRTMVGRSFRNANQLTVWVAQSALARLLSSPTNAHVARPSV